MLLLQLILIGLNAVFACAEIAVINIGETKLAKLASEGDKRAKRLVRLTKEPSRFLATIQVAITLAGFLGSAFAAENFSDRLVEWVVGLGLTAFSPATLDTIAVILITLVLSYITLIFGELVPKRIAMRKAEGIALALSGVITFIAKLFFPIVWLLTASTNGILRLMGIDPNQNDEDVSEEDIRMMVDVGTQNGAIDNEEKEFIQNVFEFDDLTAGEIATHRTEVAMLWTDESMEEWNRIIHDTRHAIYPVCHESVDDIVGVLNAKDYFRLDQRDRETVMAEAVRPAYFIPEGVKADLLFRNMKRSHHKFAIVLDEHGGMVGIVTINDLVERLVGSFTDDAAEKTEEEQLIEKTGENTWRISGMAALADVAEELGVTLPTDDHETFGGYVFAELGSIPEDGTTCEVETEELTICVTGVSDHQMDTALVTVKAPAIPKEEEETEE